MAWSGEFSIQHVPRICPTAFRMNGIVTRCKPGGSNCDRSHIEWGFGLPLGSAPVSPIEKASDKTSNTENTEYTELHSVFSVFCVFCVTGFITAQWKIVNFFL